MESMDESQACCYALLTLPDCFTWQLLDTLPLCRDFRAGLCDRPTCKFVHVSEGEYVKSAVPTPTPPCTVSPGGLRGGRRGIHPTQGSTGKPVRCLRNMFDSRSPQQHVRGSLCALLGNSELWLAFIFKQILITLWSLNTSVLLSEFVITDNIVHNYTIVYLSTIVSLHRTASMKWSSMCFSWTDWLSQSCLATPPDNTCSRFNYSFQISLWLLDCSIGTDRIGAYCRRYVVWPL